jgi:hypothetical protein
MGFPPVVHEQAHFPQAAVCAACALTSGGSEAASRNFKKSYDEFAPP